MKIIIFALLIVLLLAQQDQSTVQQSKSTYLSSIPSLRKAAYQPKVQPQQALVVAEQTKVQNTSNVDVKLPQVQATVRVNSPTRVQHIAPTAATKVNDQKAGNCSVVQKSQSLSKSSSQQKSNLSQQQHQKPVQYQQQNITKKSSGILIQHKPQPKPEQQTVSSQQQQTPKQKSKNLRSNDAEKQNGNQKTVQSQQQKVTVQTKKSNESQTSSMQSTTTQQVKKPQLVNEKLRKKPTVQQALYGTQFPNLGQLKNWNHPSVAPVHSS